MTVVAVLGISAALLAAVGQALSYLLSRQFLSEQHRSGWQLLVLSNVWMGLFSVLILALVWRTPAAGWSSFAVGMAMSMIGYLLAQTLFFWVVRFVPASRISPLLGIKIAFVAVLAWILGTASMAGQHWLAVAVAVLAALAIQRAAEPIPLRGLLGVLGVAACFAVSDNGIALMNHSLDGGAGSFSGAVFVVAITYGALLPLAIPACWSCGSFGSLPWRASLPYALVWYGSMIFLFAGISLVGVVLAIICQAMRGPLSLFLSLAVARCGWHHLELLQGRLVFARQLAAAALMVVAIVIYAVA